MLYMYMSGTSSKIDMAAAICYVYRKASHAMASFELCASVNSQAESSSIPRKIAYIAHLKIRNLENRI